MQPIFISYRRTDNADAAGRIYDRLKVRFGEQNVFKDVDSIPYGSDFRKRLSDVVASCQVFLAVIGVNWINSKDEAGVRRLDSPNDFIRIEIEAALARDIPLIPVLVANASVPTEDQLPPSIAALSYRHAIEVRPDPDFHRDMDRLVNTLRDMLRSGEPSHRAATPGVQAQQVKESLDSGEPHRESSIEHTTQPEVAVSDAELLPEDIETVAVAVKGLKTAGVDYDVPNVALVARQLHTRFMGKEVLAICELLSRPSDNAIEKYKLIKVLAISIRQLESKSFVGPALDTLIDYGVMDASLIRSALEAFAEAPVPPRDKWSRLRGTLTLVSEQNLSSVVYRLVELAPKDGRQQTGADLVEILRTTNNSSLVSAICSALKTLPYRAAIPQLLAVLEEFPINLADPISELLVEWRVIEAAPVLRSILEMNRFGTSYYLREYARRLYQLEGATAAGFLADVLADALPDQQCLLLGSLKGMNESVFLEVVTNLAANSLEIKVRTQAAELLGTERAS